MQLSVVLTVIIRAFAFDNPQSWGQSTRGWKDPNRLVAGWDARWDGLFSRKICTSSQKRTEGFPGQKYLLLQNWRARHKVSKRPGKKESKWPEIYFMLLSGVVSAMTTLEWPSWRGNSCWFLLLEYFILVWERYIDYLNNHRTVPGTVH